MEGGKRRESATTEGISAANGGLGHYLDQRPPMFRGDCYAKVQSECMFEIRSGVRCLRRVECRYGRNRGKMKISNARAEIQTIECHCWARGKK